MSPFWSVCRLRCPSCRRGAVFAGLFRMHDVCAACGLRFEREPGYFLGSYYFSYFALLVIAVPVWFLFARSGYPEWAVGTGVSAGVIVVGPFVTRWARVLWMHFDHVFDPRSPGDDQRT